MNAHRLHGLYCYICSFGHAVRYGSEYFSYNSAAGAARTGITDLPDFVLPSNVVLSVPKP